MSFELSTLFGLGLGYLFLLFAIAYAAERRVLPKWLIDHPATYVLSLAVFASALAIYGLVGFAGRSGYAYLSYYIGVSTVFILAPLLLLPLLRICSGYRLNSLADLLTFRFRSQWAGSMVTAFMLLAMMPLLALQIQAVSESIIVLTQRADDFGQDSVEREGVALAFCIAISVFTMLFGSRHLASRENHRGLVAAIAFESLVKLVAFLTVGLVAVFGVFGGFGEMQSWLATDSTLLATLNQPIRRDSLRIMLIIFFAATVCLPHFFHMLFAENPSRRRLITASWGLPLYLLLISLPVLPILWAGTAANASVPTEYFPLIIGEAAGVPWLSALVYVGGLSAASGAIIVATLALASMSLNHLVLPLYQPSGSTDIYRWLLWTRRGLIAAIILAGYLFYHFAPLRFDLSDLGITALSGCLQFLPGVLAVLYWAGANRKGFITGLCAGLGIWLFGELLPLMGAQDAGWIRPFYIGKIADDAYWVAASALGLGFNVLVFIVVSLLTRTSEEERIAAEVCSLDDLNRPTRQTLSLRTADEMKYRLAEALGEQVAEREVRRALEDLQLEPDEKRPYALRRLRDRLEINISALMGPAVARSVVNRVLPYASESPGGSEDITFIESRLEHYQAHLTGLAADLDNLRRYHRQTLDELPIGLCSVGRDKEVLMWNRAMGTLTGIPADDITGSSLDDLPPPWNRLLDSFFASPALHRRKQRIEHDGSTRWINLHKTSGHSMERNEEVIVVEDITDTQLLEDKLTHQERLASIGRLAAGVAHEIGNPVTGIACLAQNLEYDSPDPESLESAQQILKQTQRINSIVQSLVHFAHTGREGPTRGHEAVDIRRCVDEAIHLLSLDREANLVSFENRCPPGTLVQGETQSLMQVFINLLNNARDASPSGGKVIIDARPEEDERVHITVTDEGEGIDPALLEQVFEPFFTTKEPGKGTGLGLALVYNIIEDLQGDISLESPAPGGKGSCVNIHLAASGAASAA